MQRVTDANALRLHNLLNEVPEHLRELAVNYSERARGSKHVGDRTLAWWCQHKYERLMELAAELDALVLPFRPARRVQPKQVSIARDHWQHAAREDNTRRAIDVATAGILPWEQPTRSSRVLPTRLPTQPALADHTHRRDNT